MESSRGVSGSPRAAGSSDAGTPSSDSINNKLTQETSSVKSLPKTELHVGINPFITLQKLDQLGSDLIKKNCSDFR